MTQTTIAIYIPRILKFHTVDSIANMFFHAGIGNVHRVDLVTIENDQYMSAFVHMKEVNSYSYLGTGILSQFAQDKGYRFRVSPDEFWILLKAKNIVPDTRLNVHQLAENHRLLEEVVASQATTIASQAEEMARMKGDIDRLQETIYHLLAVVPGLDTADFYYRFNFMKYGKYYDKGYLYGKDGDVKEGEGESDGEYGDMPELISPSDEEDNYLGWRNDP